MVNACLNTLSAVLLLTGYTFIRRGNRNAHRFCMITAFVISIVFLISYLIHHALAGIIYYPGHGASRILYFTVLWTHTPLAMPGACLSHHHPAAGFERGLRETPEDRPDYLPYLALCFVTGVVVYFNALQGFSAIAFRS